MSLKFNPDNSLLKGSWVTVLLSERDVAGQIPINFVTIPAVSVRTACFGNNVFERNAAEKCISNLLAVGFRRFEIDIYWSSDLQRWLICPVSIPESVYIETLSATPTSTANVAEGTVTAEIDSSSGYLLYNLGSYQCSDGLDAEDVLDIFLDYFKDTSSQLNIYTRCLSFNLHAATSATAINQPASAVAEDQLPTRSDILSNMIRNKLGSYIYTPSRLYSERQNLNGSWYEVEPRYRPIVEYFTIEEDSSGVQRTPNGWPSTKYLQLAAQRRMLVEYGSVDPQLGGYNLSAENEVIFPPGYLTSTMPVSLASDGGLASGCLYSPDATDISQVNGSWAISSQISVPSNLSNDQTLRYLSNMAANMTACGLTPSLNNTLFSETADESSDAYRNVSLSSSWAWAAGQPQTPSTDVDTNERCAVMDLSSMGRWRSANCTEARHSACRVNNMPFTWTLSSNTYSYADAYTNGCGDSAPFSVPRTGLENTYLYRHLLSRPSDVIDPSSSDPLKHEVWIDFNSIDIHTCWVSGGPEAICPYRANPQKLERRTVIVSAIAGIVILIIFALTLFVKCNANRRNSRRNRRVIQGWEYEGVPS
ncbi:hypothetical protein P175DRAFT_0517770 [Aspergillus ochraceoroseus IBT 24754]|uniref:Maintenance of telomere capping protein 6 n=1 Tax=Aspergillus ochraceoroseus IBT 24754 TaxID=1392256 RepID=A0A2T5LTB6_9EURO|nr:uncharacterized protein P175DRAFT_0517770 [Aspergillus ochraceoroseus IBT 24754]PTU19518.1 hypothetical protein P175DRAFT_0517770 [Aspergillus ochraceoroseus IBT 24754]